MMAECHSWAKLFCRLQKGEQIVVAYTVCRRTEARRISYLSGAIRRHTPSISPSVGRKVALYAILRLSAIQ